MSIEQISSIPYSLSQLKRPTPAPVSTGRGKTVNRSDLGDAIVRKAGLTRSASALMVEIVLGEISDAIARGEPVKLRGFGNFSVRSKGERVGRNPKTGAEATISPRKVLTFKASPVLRDLINLE